jgi:asparagine synthase (glutamine-hydrolysing)
MCGIVGIINSNGKMLHENILDIISHRGPDDFGDYCEKEVYLGHRRLSIVDLSATGHQPMQSVDEKHVIVFNGEIYNHLDIKKDLIEKGYTFNGVSDTETLLYGFIEYGPEILKKLNGIFAFAIFSKDDNSIFIARDHFGVKPLYYFFDGFNLCFSSELKAIINQKDVNKDLDFSALSKYINYLYSPDETTPFKSIKKLAAGHFIRYKIATNQFELSKYYDIPFDGKVSNSTLEVLTKDLEHHLINAVERQLMSDVPIGFFLSGGLDSSLIAAIAQKLNPEKIIECFTIDYGSDKLSREGFADDLFYAKLISQKLNFKLNIVKAEIDIVKDFDKMIWHLDEPQADPAPLNVLNICYAAKQKGIKVLLGGTAGDDVFSGYRRHQALSYEKYLDILPKQVWTFFYKISSNLDANKPLNRRLRKFLNETNKSKLDRMAGYFAWLPYAHNFNLFTNTIQDNLNYNHPSKVLFDLLKNIPNETSDLNKMLYWEMKTFLMGHNLNYTDKMSMAVGVEARVPFLDLDLVNFSTTIPAEFKLKGNETKYILKKVAEKYLPKEIIYRPKSGFGAPIRKWIIVDLEDMIKERLAPDVIKARGIFDEKAVWQLINDNKAGKIDASYTVWSLLAIESWMQQFVDGKKLF